MQKFQNEQSTNNPTISSQIRSKTTLFVRNIPYDATDSEFESFFSEIGPLRSCFTVKETKNLTSTLEDSLQKDNTHNIKSSQPDVGKNRGFGFVQYVLNQDAERALKELKKVKFRGQRTLKLEFALKKHEKPLNIEKKLDNKQNNAKKTKLTKTKKKESKQYEMINRTLVIEGLPKDMTRKKFYKEVRKLDNVEDMIYPIEEGKNIAHVTFKTVNDATEMLKRLDGYIFEGSKINAKLLVEKKTSVDKKCRLIVRNIPWEYQESELLKIFSVHGEVVEVNLPRKYLNGPLRGFAYIQYKKVEEAKRAIDAMNETKHHGRTIAVDWALSKDRYLEAMTSQQGKHSCEHDHYIDSCTEEGSEEEPEELSENETDESEDHHEKGDKEVYENSIMDIDHNDDIKNVDDVKNNSIKNNHHPLSEEAVLFIRNLSFEATEEELGDIFRPFGPLRYYVITRDGTTGRSRGTGFVCFVHKEHAEVCLEEAKNVSRIGSGSMERSELPTNEKKRKWMIHKSVLTTDPSDSLAHKFTLHGRVLSVVRAVNKDEAHRLMEMNQNKRQKIDRRNTYLIKEGAVFPNTPDAALIPSSEVTKRVASYSTRKNLLKKNPNLFISKTRLSVRNLPLSVDEKKLKNLGKESIKKFKEEVKNGKRVDLTKTEKSEGWDKLVHIKQAKIVRSKDRIDSTTQKLRSKGYGFLEYTQHSHALAALRYLNNNPDIFGDKKRLIVEFSMENNIIVKKRTRLTKKTEAVRGQPVNP